MICLDTNYLILGLIKGSDESHALIEWHHQGEALVAPMPAWYEFLCGPVNPAQVSTIRAFLVEIIPFGETQSEKAAELFTLTGRNRRLKIDGMIAATAICANAALATNNRDDFKPFVKHGLKLI
ncbi:MAG: PIN domain-containing protein [Verrucomicrobia bacterium]|nr:PIN domain-containing protein [Verrucomicrobiota bacterium]